MTSDQPKRPSLRNNILGISLIALLLAGILSAGPKNITPENVSVSLNRFSDFVSAEAANSGKDAKFSYGNMSISGWGSEKYAVVSDIRLDVKKQSIAESTTLTLTTPKIQVTQDAVALGRLNFVFTDPVTIATDGKPVATVTFSEPLKYAHTEGRDKDPTVIQMLALPPQITFTALSAPEGAKPETLTVTYERNPVLKVKTNPVTHQREADYYFKHINLVSSSGSNVAIGALTGHMSETAGKDNQPEGEYKLMVSDFTTVPAAKPCSFTTEMSYAGERPLMKVSGLLAGTRETQLHIKNMMLTCDEFKVAADGDVARLPDDPLVSGLMHVSIENPAKFLASDLIDANMRTVLSQALTKIAGQPVDSLPRVEIPLKRDKNSTFMIGDITFEELAASLLANAINLQQLAPASPAATVPAEPAEPAAPVEPAVIPAPNGSTEMVQPPVPGSEEVVPMDAAATPESPTTDMPPADNTTDMPPPDMQEEAPPAAMEAPVESAPEKPAP